MFFTAAIVQGLALPLPKLSSTRTTVCLTTMPLQVTYDPLLVSPAEICEAIDDAGFEGSVRAAAAAPGQLTLVVTGMTCGSCVESVEQVLMGLEGEITGHFAWLLSSCDDNIHGNQLPVGTRNIQSEQAKHI